MRMPRSVQSLCAVVLILCSLAACEAGVQFNLTKSAPSSPTVAEPASVEGSVGVSSAAPSVELLFVSYVRRYQRVYTAVEFQRRFTIFCDNLAFIDRHNADQSSSHRLGVTEHADWTAAEFKQYRLGYRRPSAAKWADVGCDTAVYSSAVPAASLDWRASSAVSAVKNQGSAHRHTRKQTVTPSARRQSIRWSSAASHGSLGVALTVSLVGRSLSRPSRQLTRSLLRLSAAVCVQVSVARVGRLLPPAAWRGCGPFATARCCR